MNKVSAGANLPQEINVVIEIPMHGGPVKYEVDKDTNVLTVDRLMQTAMYYPANYGYMPQSLGEDGDPVDVMVVTPIPLICGSVITVRPVGMLQMRDESGKDAKIVAVPVSKITKLYDHIKNYDDLDASLIAAIEHFFNHYKDLEKGKWVEISGWEPVQAAFDEITNSIKRFESPQAVEN